MNKYLALLVTSTFAVAAVAENMPTKGLNLGLQGGYLTGKADLKRQIGSGPTVKGTQASDGGIGGLFLGCSHIMANNLYLNAEVSGDLMRNKGETHNFSAIDYRVNAQGKYRMGVDLHLGYVYHGWTPYIKAGYSYGSWDIKAPEVGNYFTKNHSHKKGISGYSFGVGVSVPVNPKVALGAEFTHSRYQSKKVDIMENGQRMARFDFKPILSTFMLRLKWTPGIGF